MNILLKKSLRTIKTEGYLAFGEKTYNFLKNKLAPQAPSAPALSGDAVPAFMDVLFINGCDQSVPHPARYRVSHQREQLFANNIVNDEVFYLDLKPDFVYRYRLFIFFRCPITDTIESFIKQAKQLNKTILFDIDDLVIDTKYTDTIPYVLALSEKEKSIYDDGVHRMGKTLSMCDAAITTTEKLATELSHYVPEVFINRNTASEKMLELSEIALEKIKETTRPIHDEITIGYFSGSITHNEDFAMVEPVITRLMEEFKNLKLYIAGLLAVPSAFAKFQGRVICEPFTDWQRLPGLISRIDINIAPLTQSIFNEAKSENKWVEAALVKVPTVASNIGAFARMIENGKTGILCSTEQEWYDALKSLICNEAKRKFLFENAYHFAKQNCATIYTGFPLAKYLRNKMTPNVFFILPSLNISGGVLVALKHCELLQQAGYDVTILNEDRSVPFSDRQATIVFDNCTFPVLHADNIHMFGKCDKCVSTMWSTTQFLETYPNIREKFYFVQNFETDFYPPGNYLRIQANQSYSLHSNIKFITISKWCQRWLLERFERKSSYTPNGIDIEKFKPAHRDFSPKIRILIEGDPASDYKNVDESFLITNLLDRKKYEIWFMSYNAAPKNWYKVDKFLQKVPYEDVPKVYQQCHILLKTSILESFSYPPLEMMATGGYVVVRFNEGNVEYLRDSENCLAYDPENLVSAVDAIERICVDQELRKRLYKTGIDTAMQRNWKNIKKDILTLYDCQPQ